MKNFCLVTLSFFLILFFPLTVHASEQPPHLSTHGYTEDNVRYEVQGTSYTQLSSDSFFVSREVTYDGKVVPSRQIYWQEKIGSVSYSGTLALKKSAYSASAQKNTAIYEGTLTKQ